jgi:hypothetical protein
MRTRHGSYDLLLPKRWKDSKRLASKQWSTASPTILSQGILSEAEAQCLRKMTAKELMWD